MKAKELSKTQTEASRRIKKACDHIEAAQGELQQACAELCAIAGMLREWKKTAALYDKVHALWYLVDSKVYAGFDLDTLHKFSFEERELG